MQAATPLHSQHPTPASFLTREADLSHQPMPGRARARQATLGRARAGTRRLGRSLGSRPTMGRARGLWEAALQLEGSRCALTVQAAAVDALLERFDLMAVCWCGGWAEEHMTCFDR